MTPAWAWPLLILGLAGWVLAAILATGIALYLVHLRRVRKTAAFGAIAPEAAPTDAEWEATITRWRAEI